MSSVLLSNCSFNMESNPSGLKRVNSQLFAKGGASFGADGTTVMWGDSSEAAAQLMEFGKIYVGGKVISKGIDATSELGSAAIKQIK